ncbi:28S ribosomal protein S23, mitochondrial [Sardina pilchardus]|uniref:28S ribosomal protein S23, mitochondrial n=1 Tax=Sardina pilchardus TaxID=27697 RepID=UPI002E12270D
MAGSRLEKFGTVFTRVRDLMRAGVVKEKDKPIWYDVYAAFPPKRTPLHVKPLTRKVKEIEDKVPEIFYREDVIRAEFYDTYMTGAKSIDLSKSNFVSTCQRFVDKYNELQSSGNFEEDCLFEETSKALLAEGIILRRKGAPTVAAEHRNPLLDMKLADMLAEEQLTNTAADKMTSTLTDQTQTETQTDTPTTDPKPS